MHHPQHPQAAEKVVQLHDRIRDLLSTRFGEGLVRSQIDYDFPVFIIRKDIIHDVLAFLKGDAETAFTYLTTMCGLHFPDNEGEEFAMMYQLHNMPLNHRVRLKVFMSAKDLTLPTATDIWPAANWMEREAFDFYGFRFTGHPNLTRILNMDEMNYHPLRKEYALEDASRDDKKDEYFGR